MIYLGLGSNRGNRCDYLRRGLEGLTAAGVRISELSSLYMAEPVGDPSMPWFLNCVAAVDAAGSPEELLRLCQRIESGLGRKRGDIAPSPRALDLDILLYGNRLIDSPDLLVPHPRMHCRRFVLEPLVEIAPDAWHPGRQRRARDLLAGLSGGEAVFLLAPAAAVRKL